MTITVNVTKDADLVIANKTELNRLKEVCVRAINLSTDMSPETGAFAQAIVDAINNAT